MKTKLLAMLAVGMLLAIGACSDPGDTGSGDDVPAPTTEAPDPDPADPGDAPGTQEPGGTDEQMSLAEARQLWSEVGPPDYHYTAYVLFQSDHPCGNGLEIAVNVSDGVVTSAEDGFTGCDLTQPGDGPIPLTVPEWFDHIESLQGSNDIVEVGFGSFGQVSELFTEDGDGAIEFALRTFEEGAAPAPDARALLDEIRAQRDRWESNEIADYTMTVEIGCFCPEEYRGPFEIVVADGRVVSATFRGEPAADDVADQYFTIDGLFDSAEALVDSDMLDVTYDRALGFPSVINADPEFRMADEEVYVTVSGFVADRPVRSPETLTEALIAVGAAVDSAPPDATDQGDAVMCGAEVITNDDAETDRGDPVARRCFIDAADAGTAAVFVRSQDTVEGDPIVEVWHTDENGSITLYVDATRDAFGSGEWETVGCTGLNVRQDVAVDWFFCGGE
jgi:hypothetical protein